jgi:hypothetical protein
MASVDGPGIRDAARLLDRAAVLTPHEIGRLAVGYREIAGWQEVRWPLPLGRRSIGECEAAVRSIIGPERTAQVERQATEAIARARADGRVSRVRSLVDWTYGRSAAAAIADAALAVEAGGALPDADREVLLRAWVRAVGPVPAVGADGRGAPGETGGVAETAPIARELGEARALVPAVLGGLGAGLGYLLAQAADTGLVVGAVAICVPAAISGFAVARRGVIPMWEAIGGLLGGLGIGATAITAVVATAGLIAEPPQSIGEAALAVLFVGSWIFAILLVVVGLVASVGLGIGFVLGRRFHQRRAGTDRGE